MTWIKFYTFTGQKLPLNEVLNQTKKQDIVAEIKCFSGARFMQLNLV